MPKLEVDIEDISVNRVKIELMNSKELFFGVTPETSKQLKNQLWKLTWEGEGKTEFIAFDAVPTRYVYARVSAIKRIVLLWDAPVYYPDGLEYCDNFDVEKEEDGTTTIPDAIILLKNNETITYGSLDMQHDYFATDDESGLSGIQLIRIMDFEGEHNFIPVENVICLEILRDIVFPD